jgi:hypothetical protein
MKNVNKIIFILIISSSFSFTKSFAFRKGLWIWDTNNIVGTHNAENKLINECINTGITDIYLYCPSENLSTPTDQINFKSFISRMSCKSIRVWAMDGWRGYFSDLCGPSDYYAGIQNIIDYNSAVQSDEQFFGFHGDNEFQVDETGSGCGVRNAFHYGVKDINLNTTPGSGEWKSTEKQDRDSILSDYVKQVITASSMCHTAGLEYGIAIMPWITGVNWTHGAIGYQNTPLYATYNGVTKPLYQYLMDYVDEYVIMSYHTNVSSKVVPMCEDELAYADGLPVLTRPRIFSSLETYCGVAQYVSYCDTPGEDSKAHVNSEISAHFSLLGGPHPSHSGMAIHDWTGWRGLYPVSNNTTNPSYSSCATTSISNAEPVNSGWLIYPNPGESRITIKAENGIQLPEHVKVFDSMGNILLNEDINPSLSSFEINTENLVPGIYFIDLAEYKVKWVKK